MKTHPAVPSVYIVNGGPDYRRMFSARGWEIAPCPQDADLIQFTGGADVTPWLYGERPHRTTHYDWARDVEEMAIFGECLERKTPMAGICRGGQFLNVMCGGRMYQDVDGHAINGTHGVEDVDFGRPEFQATSTHHQQMRVGRGGTIVAVANPPLCKVRADGYAVRYPLYEPEIEAIWYSKQRCFCFQPHPEFPRYHELANVYFEYIRTYTEVGTDVISLASHDAGGAK